MCIRDRILYGQESGLELPCRITLFQGLPKNDKMELIVQKAVELGACEIVPMATRRAVVKLEGKKEEAKRKRWQTIAESAAKQAKRMIIPRVSPVSYTHLDVYKRQGEEDDQGYDGGERFRRFGL